MTKMSLIKDLISKIEIAHGNSLMFCRYDLECCAKVNVSPGESDDISQAICNLIEGDDKEKEVKLLKSCINETLHKTWSAIFDATRHIERLNDQIGRLNSINLQGMLVIKYIDEGKLNDLER